MNNYIFMGQLISCQKYIKIYGKYYIYIKLIVPNNKKILKYYKVIALAQGEKTKDLELYRLGDSVVIEAAISIKRYKNSFGRMNKFILCQIYDIHPTNNILNNFV
uniref:Putative single-stranded DNA binding protein n=2 Tax=Gelidium TaxID=2811 RepID=A0A411FSU9_9FLOR|nr:putative single-stranded DNA binding protein [Gelidium coulteri]YP_009565227.1 putative single-stranded DNA binding protein [Gelidium sinicola]QBA96178.1 putative single-stranded DNA binding protein [Gelidium coulteri]QBA96578.1 putative single-stranded DNA binding protein [Gelidium sinicola]